jgi:HlyD family secretion protein
MNIPAKKLSMIRDTSATDRVIAQPPSSGGRRIGLAAAAAAGLVLLVLVAGWAWRQLGAERAVGADRLRIATVERGTLVRDLSVQGRIVAAVSPTLYAPAPGIVTLEARAGDTVAKDDLLARIDSPELDNSLQRERALLSELEVAVSRQRIASQRQKLTTQRTADEAQVTLAAAEREMQRAEAAWAKHAIAQVDYLRARDALRTAEIGAAHAAADADLGVDAIEFELQTAEHQLQRQRLVVADLERQVGELAIRSPVDGIVGTVAVADRAAVPANGPLLTVIDLSQLEVELAVPEAYADELGIGMPAEIRFGGQAYAGAISAVSPEVVDGQVTARVRFQGELPAGLRQNQRVTTRVLFESREGVLKLARGPSLDDEGGRFAYVVADGMAQRRPIEIGATSLSEVEIVSGLQAGERVVISGTEAFEGAATILIND